MTRTQPQAPAAPTRQRVATRRYELELVGASEDDLGRALECLPLGVTYSLRELGGPPAEATIRSEPVT